MIHVEPPDDIELLRPLSAARDPVEVKRARMMKEVDKTLDLNDCMSMMEEASVTDKTREQYRQDLDTFLRERKLQSLRMPVEQLDAALVKAFDEMYLAGSAFTSGEKLWSAVRFHAPFCGHQGRLHLPRCVRALKGWRRLTPQKTRRPMPWVMAAAIARLLLDESVGMALAWLLMIDTYMRPGECISLLTSQILAPTGVWPMLKPAILLHPDQRAIASKTGEMNESLILHRAWLGRLLMLYKAQRKRVNMWDFSMSQWRAAFLRAAPQVGLDRWTPCLYQARHTGASLDRLEERISLEEVKRRGRWRAETSVRRYEKRALIQEVYLSMTEAQRRFAHRATAQLEAALQRRLDASRRSSRRGVIG